MNALVSKPEGVIAITMGETDVVDDDKYSTGARRIICSESEEVPRCGINELDEERLWIIKNLRQPPQLDGARLSIYIVNF